MGDELAQARRRVDDFAGAATDEIRAALAELRARLDAVTGTVTPRPEEQPAELAKVHGAAHKLDAMLEALVALVRRSCAAPTRVEPGALVAAVVDARGAGPVVWSVEELPAATGDPAALRVIFAELVDNACKFARGSTPPRVTIGFDAAAGAYFVRDNGVGFEPRYADDVGVPFRRMHAAEEFEGRGTGLATVRRLVHRLGGRVWLETTSGAGTCVRFTVAEGADAATQLARAEAEREALRYAISHDLRAPLRHVRGFLEMFERRAAPLPEATAEAIGRARLATDELAQRIEAAIVEIARKG